ncbi:MAG: cobalamin-dependent protein [Desulfobacterales bacterium]|nr:cobalamin-dependent protein [Desulfobacterales bacterium]
MGIIATILHEAGFSVRVIDNNSQYKFYSDREFVKIIQSYSPDVIGFNITMLNALETYRLVKKIKGKYRNIILVGGGIHMKYSYTEALKNGIDIVVTREGEKVVTPLFKHLEFKNKNTFKNGLEEIQGISFLKENGNLYLSEIFPVCDDLDQIPIVNYDLFNINDYIKTKREPGLFFLTGQRGCPFTCNFCSDPIQRKDRRVSSAEWMFKNVQHLYNKYQTHYIIIADNNFTFPRERAVEFCTRMISSGLNKKIRFSCQTKVETPLDIELLKLMKKAGFKKISLGVERMIPYSLNQINKQSSSKKVYEALAAIKAANLEIGIFILIGFPFETVELLKAEEKAFLSLKKYTSNFACNILQPSPGTVYYEDYTKIKEWYLDSHVLNLKRAYFATVNEDYILGMLEPNFFNLEYDVIKEIQKFYLLFKEINYGNFLPEKTLFFSIMLKIDSLIAESSKILFKYSPTIEYRIFKKIRFMRYFFGTLLFGKKVSSS